jgi:hypothetical protein
MNATSLEYLYAKLMGPIMNTLLIEMLVLGVFFVLYSYVRIVIRQPKILTSRNFIVRLVLLVIIVFFNIFIAVSYFLDYSNVSLEELIVHARRLSDADYARAKLIFFLMAPIDVITIVLHVSMYAVISISEPIELEDFEFVKNDIRLTMRNLFLIVALFHLVSILWWTTMGILTANELVMEDITYHFSYLVIYTAGYIVAKKSAQSRSIDLLLVFYFSLAMLSVYVFRTMIFMDRLFR